MKKHIKEFLLFRLHEPHWTMLAISFYLFIPVLIRILLLYFNIN